MFVQDVHGCDILLKPIVSAKGTKEPVRTQKESRIENMNAANELLQFDYAKILTTKMVFCF